MKIPQLCLQALLKQAIKGVGRAWGVGSLRYFMLPGEVPRGTPSSKEVSGGRL